MQESSNYLIHFGNKNSGRYPRGSGENPHQHDGLAIKRAKQDFRDARKAYKIQAKAERKANRAANKAERKAIRKMKNPTWVINAKRVRQHQARENRLAQYHKNAAKRQQQYEKNQQKREDSLMLKRANIFEAKKAGGAERFLRNQIGANGMPGSNADFMSGNKSTKALNLYQKKFGRKQADKALDNQGKWTIAKVATAAAVGIGVSVLNSYLQNR